MVESRFRPLHLAPVWLRGMASLAVLLIVLAYGRTTALGEEAPREVAPGLKVGDMLDESNWQLAEGLLPPEILRHYERGEYRNPIVDYPLETNQWDEVFLERTKWNAEHLDVNDENTLVDKSTGEQPAAYYGIPFPEIDPNDLKAGVKIGWNQFLAYWYGGDTYNEAKVLMMDPRSMNREVAAHGWFEFFDGQGPKYSKPENPLNLQYRFVAVAMKPADVQGTASLTWRYRDPHKRDSVWAYVPALRRVRAVSPANRSDGYLGSDISGDDEFFFNGKPQDFDWKLIGKRDALRIVDPRSVHHNLPVRPAPGGGWISLTDQTLAHYGYNTPGWTGLYWAPTEAALAKRPVWVIEVRPHDKYYLYGRVELWIDAVTWDGAWNRKFSWQGELIHVYAANARVNQAIDTPDGREWLACTARVWACGENFKMKRATMSAIPVEPDSPYYKRVRHPEGTFDPMVLQRLGK